VIDLHRLVDAYEEKGLGTAKVGTTGKGKPAPLWFLLGLAGFTTSRVGIGPTYSTKVSRSGIRMVDMLDQEVFEKLVRLTVEAQNGFPGLFNDLSGEATKVQDLRDKLRPFLVEQTPLLREAKAKGENILIEGANGFMLDIGRCCIPWVLVGPS
jgi:adenylosuccinate synthase